MSVIHMQKWPTRKPTLTILRIHSKPMAYFYENEDGQVTEVARSWAEDQVCRGHAVYKDVEHNK